MKEHKTTKEAPTKINCRDCPKYKTCKTLCKAAETYANQDWYDKPPNEVIMIDTANPGRWH